MTTVTSFDLTTSLAGSVNGIAETATFARAAGQGTVEDFEGRTHECLDDEARFWKARRVENRFHYSNDFQTEIWAQSNGAVITSPTTFTFTSGQNGLILQPVGQRTSGAGQRVIYRSKMLSDVDVDARVVYRDADLQFSTNTFTLLAGIEQEVETAIRTTGGSGGGYWQIQLSAPTENGTLTVTDMQYEYVTGTQTDASEYVSISDIATPWHGANVDGVKYFDTDRSGVALTDMRGCLVEEASTNLLTVSNDIASWTILNEATTSDSGVSFGNGRLTRINANGNAFASMSSPAATAANGIVTISAIVKQGTATNTQIAGRTAVTSNTKFSFVAGVPTFTSGDGEYVTDSFQAQLLGDGLYRVSFQINKISGGVTVRLSADKDGVGYTDWGAAQVEEASHVGTYIPTDGATVTRPAEYLNVTRPVLTDAQWNNNSISLTSYTVADDANKILNATSLFIETDTSDNNLRIANHTSQYYFRKRVSTVNVDISLASDFLSKKRVHIATQTTTGMRFELNETSGGNNYTDPAQNLTLGDGLIHIGSTAVGGVRMNAGYSNLILTLPSSGGTIGAKFSGTRQKPVSRFNGRYF